jgi:hypothetical protein
MIIEIELILTIILKMIGLYQIQGKLHNSNHNALKLTFRNGRTVYAVNFDFAEHVQATDNYLQFIMQQVA